MLSRRVIQLMSCDDMAGIESLYFQLSEEIASKSNMEWKFPTGDNIYDTMNEGVVSKETVVKTKFLYTILWQNVFCQMMCPKASEQS